MSINALQVCMETTDWRQICHGLMDDDRQTDSSSPSEEIISCTRPLMERKLRPQQEQALKCPRCDSTHTKFCYYNNYSLSQPRYFCKTCRRYWTKGGSLRNVPVGGGCRKNKKPSKKPADPTPNHHLSFSGLQLSHHNTLLATTSSTSNPNFYGPFPKNVDFMEHKLEPLLHHLGGTVASDFSPYCFTPSTLHGQCSSTLGFSMDGALQGSHMDTGKKMLHPFGEIEDPNTVDIKPSNKLLLLDWQEQCSSDVGRDPFGCLMNGVGSWSGVMTNYGPSTTNPLI